MASTPPLSIPVPLHTRSERREAERFVASMPVSVDGHQGTTSDLSASGLSFVADRAYQPGAQIDVVIEYLLDGHQYPLRCQAEVMRVEPVAEGWRIGARLLPQSRLAEVAVPAPADGPRMSLRAIE
jgi:hypothetical protein